MSAASLPASPIQHRDIRSASKPFKRDKDHGQKWNNGKRPSAGVKLDYSSYLINGEENPNLGSLVGGSERQREKIRPQKKKGTSEHKSHANHASKAFISLGHDYSGSYAGRVVRQVSAAKEASSHNSTSPLTRSLIDLLPTHTNNTLSSIRTTAGDEGILYSFDNTVSPGQKGRDVGLGGLVDEAEKRFLAEQTERMVKGEYEVIDGQGETTVLSGKKGRRGSPRQRAKLEVASSRLGDEDDFELV